MAKIEKKWESAYSKEYSGQMLLFRVINNQKRGAFQGLHYDLWKKQI